MKTYLITGGRFYRSNFIHYLMENKISDTIINIDKMTYAGNEENLSSIKNNSSYNFVKKDIRDQKAVSEILKKYNPDVVVHFAAESHVDRSIDGPAEFVQTNIVGTSAYYKNVING